MTAIGRSDLGGSDLLALPDVTPEPLVLRDVEASLLGLLEDEHVLGGPVSPGARGDLSVLVSASAQGSGILIRDEEHTPIAALTELVPQGEYAVRGRLVPVRRRESGHRAELALDRAELAAEARRGSAALLVVARPPTTADSEVIDALLATGSNTLWVVLPDTPDPELPLAVLVATVEAWLSGIGAVASSSATGVYTLSEATTIRLRTAPLGWRDPVSDGALVARLTSALGAAYSGWLRSDDTSPGAQQWHRALTSLHEGRSGSLDGVDEIIARILLRWRPARGQRGLAVMFTGLSGSGKSTVARGVSEWLQTHTDRSVTLLDGDVVRQMLSSGLGFDREGRVANVRRIGYVAAEVTRHGGVAICAPIAPYAETRAEVRAMVEAVGDLLLLHVNTPIEVCEGRDLKGLYARARAGTLPEFTGVSDPYEEPHDAVARIDTSVVKNVDAVRAVIDLLRDGGWLEGREA